MQKAGVGITFLGAGDAFSAGGLNQSGYLVRGSSGSVLIDCGPATLTRLRQEKIDPLSIDTVLLSHFHGDHFGGVPFLLLDYLYVSHRTRPLTIAGPAGIEARVAKLYAALYPRASLVPVPYDIQFIEMRPEIPVSFGDAIVVPYEVPHLEDDTCFGFRVEIDGRAIAYSGDAGWAEVLYPLSRGADLFICECSSFDSRVPFHIDYLRILENRGRFDCKRFILSHLGAEVLSRRSEIEMELAYDGLYIELNG